MTTCVAFRDVKNNAPTLAVFFRGRRQWPQARKSADPGGHRGVRGCRRARDSNYTVLEGIGARGLRGGWWSNRCRRGCNPLHSVVKNPCLVHAEPWAPLPGANYSNPYSFFSFRGASWSPKFDFGGSNINLWGPKARFSNARPTNSEFTSPISDRVAFKKCETYWARARTRGRT